jgi:hypothetical protein
VNVVVRISILALSKLNILFVQFCPKISANCC